MALGVNSRDMLPPEDDPPPPPEVDPPPPPQPARAKEKINNVHVLKGSIFVLIVLPDSWCSRYIFVDCQSKDNFPGVVLLSGGRVCIGGQFAGPRKILSNFILLSQSVIASLYLVDLINKALKPRANPLVLFEHEIRPVWKCSHRKSRTQRPTVAPCNFRLNSKTRLIYKYLLPFLLNFNTSARYRALYLRNTPTI